MEGNCDIYGDVDFGRGVVEVRCTKIGQHTEHVCAVILSEKKEPESQNVFEHRVELPPGASQ